jgi:hypothetical protein
MIISFADISQISKLVALVWTYRRYDIVQPLRVASCFGVYPVLHETWDSHGGEDVDPRYNPEDQQRQFFFLTSCRTDVTYNTSSSYSHCPLYITTAASLGAKLCGSEAKQPRCSSQCRHLHSRTGRRFVRRLLGNQQCTQALYMVLQA